MSHKNTEKHKRNFNAAKSSVKITDFAKKKTTDEEEKIANAEVLIAGYFSEHNVPFVQVDHLLAVCKKEFPDSDSLLPKE